MASIAQRIAGGVNCIADAVAGGVQRIIGGLDGIFGLVAQPRPGSGQRRTGSRPGAGGGIADAVAGIGQRVAGPLNPVFFFNDGLAFHDLGHILSFNHLVIADVFSIEGRGRTADAQANVTGGAAPHGHVGRGAGHCGLHFGICGLSPGRSIDFTAIESRVGRRFGAV